MVFVGKEDGLLELWDLIESTEVLNQTYLVSASGLNSIYNDISRPDLLIVADKIGGIHLLQLPSGILGDV